MDSNAIGLGEREPCLRLTEKLLREEWVQCSNPLLEASYFLTVFHSKVFRSKAVLNWTGGPRSAAVTSFKNHDQKLQRTKI